MPCRSIGPGSAAADELADHVIDVMGVGAD